MINFFHKHRGVSGSISIMLSLLLLPIYSLAALLIESARYQSAKEQLSELTFMGEMAILADYVSFLASDYDIYAFDGDKLKGSFESYVKEAQGRGYIDTTKLADFLGVDSAACDVHFMYSAADPDVLEYQITQIGKYAMPADILSKVTLSALFKSIENRLKPIVNKLKLVNAVAGEIEDVTKYVYDTAKLYNDINKLETAVNDYNSKYNDYLNAAASANWSSIDSEAFRSVYNMSDNDRNKASKASQEADDYIIVMSDIDSSVKSYFNINNKNDRKKVEISLNDDDKKALGINDDGSVKLEDVLKKLYDKVKGYEKVTISSIESYSDFTTLTTQIKNSKKALDDKVTAYDNFKSTKEAIEKYNAYKASADDLCSKYESYASDLKDLTKSVTDFVDGYDTIKSANSQVYIDELNKAELEANKAGNEAYKAKGQIDEQTKAKAKEEAVKERKEAFEEAKKNKNYANIGTNTLEQFAANVSDNMIDQWTENLKRKVKGTTYIEGLPDLNNVNSADAYVDAVKKLQEKKIDSNDYKEIITKYDFKTALGIAPTQGTESSDEINKLMSEIEAYQVLVSLGKSGEINIEMKPEVIDKYYKIGRASCRERV